MLRRPWHLVMGALAAGLALGQAPLEVGLAATALAAEVLASLGISGLALAGALAVVVGAIAGE